MTTITTKFKYLSQQYRGRIIIMNYEGRSLTFTPIAPIDSTMRCECGYAEWNATNFGNTIHFCPNKQYTFVVTPYNAVDA